MRKLIIIIFCCYFFSACSETKNIDISSYPQECRDTFNKWDALLGKMRESGKFSSESLAYFDENTKFIFEAIKNEPDTETQKKACEPLNQLMQTQLDKVDKIHNMTQDEIDYEFGVTRIPKKNN